MLWKPSYPRNLFCILHIDLIHTQENSTHLHYIYIYIFTGFQNLVRSGSKKLRNSLRRHSIHRKEEQTTHTSVSSCSNLIPTVSAWMFVTEPAECFLCQTIGGFSSRHFSFVLSTHLKYNVPICTNGRYEKIHTHTHTPISIHTSIPVIEY